jgi:hypothetical protein
MISFFLTLVNFVRGIINGLKDPEFRGLFFTLLITLIVGTLFYRRAEGWSLFDSLYFSVITLSTVGYGDLAPTKIGSKIFTIMYIFMGIGILLGFVEKMSRTWYRKSTEVQESIENKPAPETKGISPAPTGSMEKTEADDAPLDTKGE